MGMNPSLYTNIAEHYKSLGYVQDAQGNWVPPSPVTDSTPASLKQSMQDALLTGVSTIGPGNTNQIQGGFQSGAYQSAESGQQQQTQQTDSSQTGTSLGNTATTGLTTETGNVATSGTTQSSNVGQTTNQGTTAGTNIGATTGTTSQLGTSSTSVDDTLGLGSLLAGQAGTAAATDASRNAYLSDLMQNGSDSYNASMQSAINNALSGPTMAGVGDASAARVAAFAASDAAQKEQALRLAASEQLAGNTASTTLANAGNSYLGSTTNTSEVGNTAENTAQTSNQSTSGITNTASNDATTNASNTASSNVGTNQSNQATSGQTTSDTSTTSLSDLLSNTIASGTADSSSKSAAYGNTPTQTATSSGGSVICTALGERGWLPHWLLVSELSYIQCNWPKFRRAAKGYFFWGVLLAKLVRRSKFVAILCLPMARWCAYEATRREQQKGCIQLPFFLIPYLAYHLFFGVNDFLGRFIPGKPKVADREIAQLLSNSGLELNLLEK